MLLLLQLEFLFLKQSDVLNKRYKAVSLVNSSSVTVRGGAEADLESVEQTD